MSANFTPERGTFKDLKQLRFWTQKILPLVYDDSLSYYEVLAKLTAKVNEVIETFNEDIRKEIIEYIQSEEFSAWLKAYIQSRKIELHSLAVIGDSNAEGFGWWGGDVSNKTLENDGYCAVLREFYPSAIIDNYAVSGALLHGTTGNVAKVQCDNLLNSGKQYEYVIIQCGMNDMGTILNTTDNVVGYCPVLKSTASTITEDYSTCVRSLISMINRIRNASPTTKIIYMVREYLAVGAPYYYEIYCALYKQIFQTCYLMNVPILNLEGNFINSSNLAQKASYYFDNIHWNEQAYRNYVTPRLIEFINNPISSGLMSNEYMFLCCTVTDCMRGYDGNNFTVSEALKTALNYILADAPYYSFNGTFLLTGGPGTMLHGSITIINPYINAKIRRGLYNQNATIYINGNTAEYYMENISVSPTMGSPTSYSGAEYQLDNASGYGVIPGGQTVFHEAHNDNRGNLTKLMTGARSGEILSVINIEENVRNDFFRGGTLGLQGQINIDDIRIQNGMYYVPAFATGNIVGGVPQADLSNMGYTLIVNRQVANPSVSLLFALTVNGVYAMGNYDGQWYKCAGV